VDATAHRRQIVELFEKHRATPGASYDEHHFLDFLLAEPKKSGALYNSFRGLRRFNAFMDDVQFEFAVCFSLKDRDANYSLPKFVERVIELQKSSRGSLMSVKNQIDAGPGWMVWVVANLVLLIAGIAVRDSGWALAVVAGIAVALNAAFGRFAWNARSYLDRLQAKIQARAQE
jgi:hypothetical protein